VAVGAPSDGAAERDRLERTGRGLNRLRRDVGGCVTFRGLRFEPDDVDWTHGHGPIVTAAEALLLALTGRRAALGALTGDGLATLRARLL
jgi:hypothetical protein